MKDKTRRWISTKGRSEEISQKLRALNLDERGEVLHRLHGITHYGSDSKPIASSDEGRVFEERVMTGGADIRIIYSTIDYPDHQKLVLLDIFKR